MVTVPCVTQELAGPPEYMAVCTVEATAIATSVHCPDRNDEDSSACGGHPICRPCLMLAASKGIVTDVTQ